MNRDTPTKQEFAEEVGLYFDRFGVTRMAGRILGWLLVCEPPHQTINDLAEALQASKGSISSMTRVLIQMGLVERFSIPGHRRDYFRVRPGGWAAIPDNMSVECQRFKALAERGLRTLEDDGPHTRERLEDMRDIYAFFEREIPRLIEQYRQERLRKAGPDD